MRGGDPVWTRLMAACGHRTFREIGDRAGLHPEVVRHGGVAGSARTVAQIAAAFDVSGDWLFYGAEPIRRSDVRGHELSAASIEELTRALHRATGRGRWSEAHNRFRVFDGL